MESAATKFTNPIGASVSDGDSSRSAVPFAESAVVDDTETRASRSAGEDDAVSERIQNLFAEADEDGTGDLDVQELRWVIEQLGMKLSQDQLHKALGVLDSDNTGAVSIDNFTQWWNAQATGAKDGEEAKERAREAFRAVDEDGGGTIDASELAALARTLGLALSSADLAAALKEMDADGSGEIDMDEFVGWYISGGTASSSGLAMGVGLGALGELGLGGTNDDENLFVTVDDEQDSDDEFDAAAAAGEMFNDLMAASMGGSKEILGLSLGMFTPDNAFRVATSKIVFHPLTEIGIVVSIVINVVALLFQEPGGDQIELVATINFVCGLIFTIEMVLRIITHGLVRHEGSYLRNGWNALDCIIVLTYWAIYVTSIYTSVDSSLSSCATLLRSFRLLRFFGGVREVLSALAQGSSMILTVSAVMMFLFVAFSTSSRMLFGGVLMNRCAVYDPIQRSLDCPWCGDELQAAVLGSGAAERCPTVLECGSKNLSCFEYTPILQYVRTNQSNYAIPRRLDHIDKFGFEGLSESLLSVYTISTLDEWGYLCNMYRSSAASTAFLAWPVFAALTVLLALFATNVFVASVTISYMSVRTAARDDNTLDGIRDMVLANLDDTDGQADASDGDASPMTGDGEWSDDDDLIPEENLAEEDLRTDHCLATCCKYGPVLTEKSQVIIKDKRFDNFIMATVLINIVLMASEHHNMPQWYVSVLDTIEIIFTTVYTFEVAVKLQGMGWRRYFRSGMNRLDFTIVFVAHAGAILSYFGEGMDASSSQSLRIVKVLARLARLMRVARVGKLISRVKSIRTVLKVAFGSMHAIASLSFLFIFVCFVAATMGTFLFWQCHAWPDGTQRSTELNGMSLGTLRDAFFAVFQLSTGDDWSGLMFEYMECYGSGAALYFVVVVFVTQYLLLNLYISVFLENFQLNDEEKRQRQIEEFTKRELANMERTKEGAALATISIASATLNRAGPMARLNLDVTMVSSQTDDEAEDASDIPVNPIASDQEFLDDIENAQASPHTTFEESPERLSGQHTEANVALGLFSENHPFRQVMVKLVESDGFDKVIVLCIALSGIHIALEGPDTYASSGLPKWFQDAMALLDWALFFAFWIELLCKLVAYGFFKHPDSYLKRSNSNILDFTVVLATSVDVALALMGFSSSAKLFRLLRVLRLVRLLLIIDGMQIILYTLAKALPSVSAILALQASTFLVFGILGINMFSGQYYRCVEHIKLDKVDCVASYGEEAWKRYEFNFDDIFEAMATLFVCMTIEGWVQVMRIGMDTPAGSCVDCAPEPNYSASVAFMFFASFMVVNAFMLDKLFVGLLVDFFQQESGSALMTSEQKNWRFMEVMAMHIVDVDRRPPTNSRLREECFNLAQSSTFTSLVNVFILLDVTSVVIGDNESVPQTLTDIFWIVNETTLAVYTYEALVRIGAYSWSGYITTDKTPFAIVLIMWVMTTHYHLKQFDWFDPDGYFDWIQGLSFVMILRMTRLLSASMQIRKLLKLLWISMPQVLNLVTIMILQFFIFGILGMKLYGLVALEGTDIKTHELNEYNNFSSVPAAMMLLFQVATGQPIVQIVEEIKSSIGGHPFVFFATFYILCNMILLNLFTALLLDNLDLMGASDFGITDKDVRWFHKRWHDFGLYVSDEIPMKDLRGFVISIGRSFSVVTAADRHWYKRLLLDLDVPPDEMNNSTKRSFSFHRVLLCLCHLRFNSACLPYEQEVAESAKAALMAKQHGARVIIVFWRAYRRVQNVPAQMQASEPAFKLAVECARTLSLDAINRVFKLSKIEEVETKTKNLATAMDLMSGWTGPQVEGEKDGKAQLDELGDEHLEKLAEGDAEAHDMLLARMEEIHQQRVKVAGGVGTWCVGGRFVGRPFEIAQKFVLTMVLPVTIFALFHVLIKIVGQHHLNVLSPAFLILVVFPAASYIGCCYIVAQYFLVPSLFSARRQMLMFSSWAGIANYGAILYGLTDDGRKYCQILAIVNNSAYVAQMAWQVTATYTAFRFVTLDKLRVKGLWRVILHLFNWGGGLLMTLSLFYLKREAFHESLDELNGLGWCGVRGDPEFMYWKLFFILIPQLIGVSVYAYCFSYIIDVVDPPETTVMRRSADDSRVSTSHHEDLLHASTTKQAVAMARAADRIKLYLTGFMLSYLTNTLLTIFLEREKRDDEWTTFDYLICAAVVTPQQALYARVFNSGGGSGIISGLSKFHKSSMVSASGTVASGINSMVASYRWVQVLQASAVGQTVTVQVKSTVSSASSAFEGTLQEANRKTAQVANAQPKNPWADHKVVVFLMSYVQMTSQWIFKIWQACVMVPVSLWVWTPIEFIKENFSTEPILVMISLLGYGLFLLVPIFYFRATNESSFGNTTLVESDRQERELWDAKGPVGVFNYMATVGLIGIAGMYVNRKSFHLLVIDGPRDTMRMTKKNCLGVYTLAIEWMQVAMIAVTAVGLVQRYRNATTADSEDELTLRQLIIGIVLDNVFYLQYWASLFAVVVWASCYAGPNIVEKLYSRKRARALQRKFGVIYFVLSGPGFLTIMKSLMKPLFCVYDDADPNAIPVVVADDDVQCWTQEHLNLVWPALCALCVYFPSSTLTTAIKYSADEDIRYVFLYNRLELITKGLMLFLSLSYVNEPRIALFFLMLGSCVIIAALHYMRPSCQKIAMRWKYFVHVSNIWTCLTCVGALQYDIDHTNWRYHLQAAAAGWAVIFMVWGWNMWRTEQQDVMNAPAQEPTTISRACSEILQLRHDIGYVTGPGAWGKHALILRLLEFATHENVSVRVRAFESLAVLSYWDHVTSEAFFIEITPTTSMVVMLNAITTEQDQALRIFAVRILGAFVRAELHIKELNRFIEEDNGVDLPESIAKLACSTCRSESQADCLQTLLAITYVDSNTLDAVAEHCIPMLAEWAQKGSVVEQHLAAEFLMLISGRFDLTDSLIANGALPKMVSLFMSVDDVETKPDKLKNNTSGGFRSGCLQPQRAVVFAHQVPQTVRQNFQSMYPRVKHIYHEDSDEVYEKVAHRAGRLEWSSWVSSGIPLAREIKQKLTAREFEGVSKVKSAGVTRQHLNELFDLMYEGSNASSSNGTERTLAGGTIARFLSSHGLGDATEIEQLLFDTGIYQHGIGELEDDDMHILMPKKLFSRWLLTSLPNADDDTITQERDLGKDTLALRVLYECVPRSREVDCNAAQVERDVEKLYDEIRSSCASGGNPEAEQLVLHASHVARYLVETKELSIGTIEQVEASISEEVSQGQADADAHVQLSALQLQILRDEITKATVHTLTEIAMAQGAQGRADIVDGGVLVIVARCFGLFKPPAVHALALNMLHALMNGRFSERDIAHDADLIGFYSEIKEYNLRLQRDANTPPLLQFEKLSALERRKAHMMADYLGMYHRSVGSPVNRKVVVSSVPITNKVAWKLLQADMDDEGDGAAGSQLSENTDERAVAADAVAFVNPIASNDYGTEDERGDASGDVKFVDIGTFDEDGSDDGTIMAQQEEEEMFESIREKIAMTGIIPALLRLTDVDAKTGKPVTQGNVPFYAFDTLLQFSRFEKVPSKEHEAVRERYLWALDHEDLGICTLGAWGIEYTNRPFFRTRVKSRGLVRFREVGRAMMVLAVWKRIGSGAGEGLDRRAADVKAAIG